MTVVICAAIRLEGRASAFVLGTTVVNVGTSALTSLRKKRAELQVQLARLRSAGAPAAELAAASARLANADAILRGRAGQ